MGYFNIPKLENWDDLATYFEQLKEEYNDNRPH